MLTLLAFHVLNSQKTIATTTNKELSEGAQNLAEFAIERIEVPRDMGMIPAEALLQLVQSPQ